jgi:transcription antitermination factor NusA-like protein
LAKNAIVNRATALHVNFQTSKDSTSTKIAFIRRLLKGEVDESNEITEVMKKVAKGEVRLVVEVTKADIMGALVRMKRDVAPDMKMTFIGGHESWMVSMFLYILVKG